MRPCYHKIILHKQKGCFNPARVISVAASDYEIKSACMGGGRGTRLVHPGRVGIGTLLGSLCAHMEALPNLIML